MKKNLLSMVAAAALALGVGASQPGCVTALDRAKVNSAIEHRESSIKSDLEEIARSVFCVRNSIEYRREGAEKDEKNITRTLYGTALAYTTNAGYTYLVTNDHVAKGDEEYKKISVRPAPGGLAISLDTYKKVSDNLTLVDNQFDKVKSDDVSVESVVTKKEIDVAILRTRTRLPVAASYIRHDGMVPAAWDEAYVVGFPRGIHKARAKGTVTNPDLRLPKDNIRYHALDVTGTFGNSGSPYFIRKGNTLYWGGVIRALLPYHLSRSPMLGVPLKNFSDMLSRYSHSPVVESRGDGKKK